MDRKPLTVTSRGCVDSALYHFRHQKEPNNPDIPQNVILVHFNDDTVLIRLSEQEVAGVLAVR